MRVLYRFLFLVGICTALIMLPHESCSCGDGDEDNDNPSIDDDDGNDDTDCENHPMCEGHSQGFSCVDNVMVLCWPGDDGCLDLSSAVNCNVGGNLVCVDDECVEPGDDDTDDDCEDNPLCPDTFGWICLESWLIFCQPGPDGCLDIVSAGDCGENGQVCVDGNCEDTLGE